MLEGEPSTGPGAGPVPVGRVLLVDDHRMFTDLLIPLLEADGDLQVIGVAANGQEAEQLTRDLGPAVVVLDAHLPGTDAVALARRLRRARPAARIVLLTHGDDRALAPGALAAGCVGLVTKDRAPGDLVDLVRAAHAGDARLDDGAIGEHIHRAARTSLGASLTTREREALTLLAEGASTRDIAARLFISHNTARNHVQRLIAKLGAHSRLEAVAIARRAGMLEPALATR